MKTSFYLLSAAVVAVLSVSSLAVRADGKTPVVKTQKTSVTAEPTVIRAQGHPSHVDFVARSSKRADLRANIARKGLDAAFTEWLRTEHSHVYRQHLEQTARESRKSTENKVAER